MSRRPIGDYAFLSDARTSALVSSDGSVDWLCLPRFDSAASHARLLDEQAGHFLLRPADPDATAARRYLPMSLVLETTWTCATGTVVVRDALAVGRREREHDVGIGSPGVLLRYAECLDREVELVFEWAPRPEFGLIHPSLTADAEGVVSRGGATVLRLSTDARVDIGESVATGSVGLTAGQATGFALEQSEAWDAAPRSWSTRRIRRRVDDTVDAWQSWSVLHQRYRGPLEADVHRSGLILRGLTFVRTGAIVAAATTSLPEGVGTGRTWDYRYTWVRDASLTMRGLWVAACPDEGVDFFAFLERAAATQLRRGVDLQIMFGIGGERDLTERELPHLSGWRDSAPVRVGNGAWTQRQLDVYGALLDAAHTLRDQFGELPEPTRELLIGAVDAAAARWDTADQGIWEVRGPARRYVHSTLMCWVALDRGIALAEMLGAIDRVPEWEHTRARIRDALLDEGWNDEVGAFTQSFGSTHLDAATLLIGLVGIVPADDPRVLATLDAVSRDLLDERGLVRRYIFEDGLEGAEGSFLLCTFWLAEAYAAAGRIEEAETFLHRGAGYANDLGLLAEQVDTTTGELLGNYPQAFSHLGLVLAAEALARAVEQRADAAPSATRLSS